MRRLRLIIIILRRSGAGKVLLGFLLIYLACGVVVQVAEPSVESYGDALWFLWAVSTTVGLGDFTAVSAAGSAAGSAVVSGSVAAGSVSGIVVEGRGRVGCIASMTTEEITSFTEAVARSR